MEAQRFFPEPVSVGLVEGVGRDTAAVSVVVGDNHGFVAVLEVAARDAGHQRRGCYNRLDLTGAAR